MATTLWELVCSNLKEQLFGQHLFNAPYTVVFFMGSCFFYVLDKFMLLLLLSFNQMNLISYSVLFNFDVSHKKKLHSRN